MHEQRREGGGHRHARRRELARPADRREQPPQRGHDEREVRREADRALLGGDRDRDRVRGVRRALGRGVLRPAVLAPERSRAEAADRLLGEQAPAARDEVVATARRVLHRLVRIQVQSQRARGEQHDRDPDDRDGPRRRERPPDAPPERADHREPDEQRDERRLGERQHEPGPQQREDDRAGERGARSRRPRHHRRDADHHDDEEAPVDVRVEEERVDPEVGLELVRVDDARVQEQVLRRVLPEADAHERDRQDDEHPERPRGQARRPPDALELHEQDGEGDVEEDDGLQRPVEVARVGRLRAVEDEHRGERPLQRARPALLRVGVARRPHEVGDGAGGHHEVQRQEQVRGVTADVQRDAERQRRGRQQRQQRGATHEEPRHDADRREADHDEHRRQARIVAQGLDLVRRPHVPEQHGDGQDERAEHRGGPRHGRADDERGRGGEARGDDAGGGRGLPRARG